MDVLVERCAGLDVHRDSVMATVRLPARRRRQREQHTARLPVHGRGLQALADWLEGFGVTLVGMEATGIYWRTVFDALEPRFPCWLLNARHLRNVPGRKSDVSTRPGSASWSSTGSCVRASCRRGESAACAT